MSDIDGAQAPAESTPATELPLDTPNPITTEAEGQPEPEKVETKPDKPEPKAKVSSIDEALDKAAEKVAKSEKPEAKEAKTEKVEAKPEVKSEVKRDETGKFASDKPKVEQAKPSYTAGDPPARFTADVKAKWAELPENVRGEVSRMERELTQGYEKHKAAAERDATLAEFHEMAKQSGKDLRSVVGEYVNMENLLRKDLVGGLDTICQRLGVSLKDVAAHVMGQTPDQNASAQDATIRELRAELAAIQQQVGNVTQTFQKQQETAVSKEVTEFAAAHPRFDELSEDIAFFLKTRTKDLSEAYTLAERLNPAPVTASKPAASAAAPDLAAQTAKGQKSISGAPSAGSSPAAKRRSKSIDESLDRAFAQGG
jgi:hypothetical protein